MYPPPRTTQGGTSGGACVISNPGKEISHDLPTWADESARLGGPDWVGVIIHTRKVSIFLVFAYFNWADPTRCQTMFNQILVTKKALGFPSVLVADFNKTPQEIKDEGWADLFQGDIQQPTDSFGNPCPWTCRTRTIPGL